MNRPRKLERKLAWLLYAVLTLTSLLFLFLLYGAYQIQLRSERAHASAQLNLLLSATLENAMLKRDIDGLVGVMDRLAAQPDVLEVALLSPDGEVRFSSGGWQPGERFSETVETLCDGCGGDFRHATITTRFTTDAQGRKVLRSINPVRNKPVCAECHGPADRHPVNGLLVVDYDAEPMLQKARYSLAMLLLAGFVVMLLTLATVWWFIRRHVVTPVTELEQACQRLSEGALEYRPEIHSDDEFGSLGRSFNQMAQRLENSMGQLLEKEAYLQALIDAIPDGVRVIDRDFNIVNANRAYRKMIGDDSEAMSSERCYRSAFGRDTPCPATLITCPVEELKNQTTPIKTMQTFQTKSGKKLDLQVFAAPMHVESTSGRASLIVESIRDLNKDIRFSHEQKLAALGQLAAGVGHEIRNPLSAIRLALHRVLKNAAEGGVLDRQAIDYLELVDQQIDHCLDITDRLLKMSALPGNQRQPVDVHAAISETVSLIRYEGERQGIDIQTRLTATEPRVMATETDLRMIVLNLIQNAFHAMPDGGRLDIATENRGRNIVIHVCDDGAGIDADALPHIFDPFFSRRADGKRGIGLGLPICRSLVERHGGQIGVIQHVAGFNTCFEVVLPTVGADP